MESQHPAGDEAISLQTGAAAPRTALGGLASAQAGAAAGTRHGGNPRRGRERAFPLAKWCWRDAARRGSTAGLRYHAGVQWGRQHHPAHRSLPHNRGRAQRNSRRDRLSAPWSLARSVGGTHQLPCAPRTPSHVTPHGERSIAHPTPASRRGSAGSCQPSATPAMGTGTQHTKGCPSPEQEVAVWVPSELCTPVSSLPWAQGSTFTS